MSESQAKNSASEAKNKKKERLAAQLRANLRKRKAQSQVRKTSDTSRDDMGDKG